MEKNRSIGLNRRYTDRHMFYRMWKNFNPYLQIGGFLILCTFVFTNKWNEVEAYGVQINDQQQRIVRLEASYERIDQSLQDIKQYFGIKRSK